jgi:hypothetical protein
MRKLISCVVIIVCLILLVPVSGGCSKTEEENTFLELLSLLPATAKDRGGFVLINYEKLWHACDISLYSPDGQAISREDFRDIIREMDDEGRGEELQPLSLSSYLTGYSSHMLTSTIQDEYVGYDFADIEAEIYNIYPYIYNRDYFVQAFSEKPNFRKDMMLAAIGKYDPEVIGEALNNRDGWPVWAVENYLTEDYQNVIIHSWGDGNETHYDSIFMPPHIDEMGRAIPLAVNGGHLLFSVSVDDVKAMIDGSLGKVHSLADVPEYAQAAEGLQDLEAIVAIIADESLATGSPAIFSSDPGPLLKKFITFGSGIARDGNNSYIALVIIHESPDDARENVSLLEQQIETFSLYFHETESDIIQKVDIRVEGEVILAKLYIDAQLLWDTWIISQEVLLIHKS